MRKISFNLWPDGKDKACTFSYDDGQLHDIRMIEILDENGLKGTFHLNSGNLGRKGIVAAEDLGKIYAEHEIATHMVYHPFPTDMPDDVVLWEFLEDRKILEQASGRVIKGMSYPFGNYDERVIKIAKEAGIVYGRTTKSHGNFTLPGEWLAWHPTCHDSNDSMGISQVFMGDQRWSRPQLLYIWGHSYEFPQNDRWNEFEELCAFLGKQQDRVWFATNIEIFEYRQAVNRLTFSADCSMVKNPSAQDVYITVEQTPVHLPPGSKVVLP